MGTSQKSRHAFGVGGDGGSVAVLKFDRGLLCPCPQCRVHSDRTAHFQEWQPHAQPAGCAFQQPTQRWNAAVCSTPLGMMALCRSQLASRADLWLTDLPNLVLLVLKLQKLEYTRNKTCRSPSYNSLLHSLPQLPVPHPKLRE
jgi:hypothetical protein